ncbi:MAG: efflux RND transporter permease subunit [Chryseolinea sp.]
MLRYLIARPIGVTMVLVGMLILGLLSLEYIPVSLMPDISIPKITIRLNLVNSSAREIENLVTKPIREELLKVEHLDDIRSETRDEGSIINLFFNYGTDINLAEIQVNEKIDQAMGRLPRNLPRPRVLKASVSDIPILYLNVTASPNGSTIHMTSGRADSVRYSTDESFAKLSQFASQVLRKRLEQLPEVALVDISGVVTNEICIYPDNSALQSLNLTAAQIGDVLQENHVELGNLLIQDGRYQYNVRFGSSVRTKEDIENIYISLEGRTIRLKQIARITEQARSRKGLVMSDFDNAITLAVIKQGDAQVSALEDKLKVLIDQFRHDYPQLSFKVTKDQTELLDYSISNLNQDIFWGVLLSLLIMTMFLGDYKSPLLIGITMPVTLVISIGLFYLFNVTINIISLAGLVLGIGMMIDNSIIVIENIVQFRERGFDLVESCQLGAQEVFLPMLSSVLTTCAVFIPLVFLSGISGALFYDEAMAVAIGSFVSLAVSVTIIPVYYRIMYLKPADRNTKSILQYFGRLDYEAFYERSFTFLFRRPWFIATSCLLIVIGGVFAYEALPSSRLPELSRDDVTLKIDWNDRINVHENARRIIEVCGEIRKSLLESTCLVGDQDFILDAKHFTSAEASIYIRAQNPYEINRIRLALDSAIRNAYPAASWRFVSDDNIFDVLFSDNDASLIARFQEFSPSGHPTDKSLTTLAEVKRIFSDESTSNIDWQEYTVLKADPLKLMIYNISSEVFYTTLRNVFSSPEILNISADQNAYPIVISAPSRNIRQTIMTTEVMNEDGILFPVKDFVSVRFEKDVKTIHGGKEGEYFPIEINEDPDKIDLTIERIKQMAVKDKSLAVSFTGSIFSTRSLTNELRNVLLVALVMLYLILAIQFESLLLPVIILIEIPIDIAGAFIFLKLFGGGLNLMSLIGLVVMGGIIINDSILKIDTIIRLQRAGMPLLKAIIVGGKRRLKSILMTCLITVLAMIPLLLTPGMGSELQYPLAIALIGGMLVGTLISLYVVPMCFFYVQRRFALSRISQ